MTGTRPARPPSGWGWRGLALLLKVSFSGLLLWLCLRGIPLHSLRQALHRVDLPLACASVLLFAAAIPASESARMWAGGALLAEERLGFREWGRIFLQSRPFIYLLPSAVGAEGMIWAHLREHRWGHGSCVYLLLSTRVWGLGVWALAAGLFCALAPEASLRSLPLVARRPSLWLLLGGCACLGSVASRWGVAAWSRVPLAPFRSAPLLGSFGLTLASAGISILAGLWAARAIGLPMAPAQVMGIIALLNFALVLPISVAGVGVQEGVVLLVGGGMGFQEAHLLGFSAILHLQRLAIALAGLGVLRPRRDPGAP